MTSVASQVRIAAGSVSARQSVAALAAVSKPCM